jgi:hypothetical protein
MPSSGRADQGEAALQLETYRRKRHVSDRRAEYLTHAYACHDMALRAGDAADRDTLWGMTIVWQTLAQRAPARPASTPSTRGSRS